MKFYVQWAQATPKDWKVMNSAEWPNIIKGSEPTGTETLSDEKLWVHSINVQGMVFHSFDHYAIIYNTIAVWNDDPEDWQNDYWGQVWTFLDPAPDPRIGGRINTRQSFIYYCESNERAEEIKLQNIDILDGIKDFSEFPIIDQRYVGHGIWMSDELNEAHMSCRSNHGWREWIV
jgi:hypothetical protein